MLSAGKRETAAQPGAGHSACFSIFGVKPIASLGTAETYILTQADISCTSTAHFLFFPLLDKETVVWRNFCFEVIKM